MAPKRRHRDVKENVGLLKFNVPHNEENGLATDSAQGTIMHSFFKIV